jgi:hypothetical protein
MSGLTASNLPLLCGVRAVTCTSNARKRATQQRYRHAATASGWTERNLIPPTIVATGTPSKRCDGESRRGWPRLHREGCSAQQPQPLSVAQACIPSLEAQPTSAKSVQAPTANSSSLNDTFRVVTTIFQRTVTEPNGAKWKEQWPSRKLL